MLSSYAITSYAPSLLHRTARRSARRSRSRSPPAETRKAPCQALYTPAIRSRHGSFVSDVSRTNVSQRSTSCSRRIPTAWSSFSCASVAPGAARRVTLPAVVQRSTTSRRGRSGSRSPCTARPAARLRAVVSTVAGVAFPQPTLKPAPRALGRAVPPLHVSTAAQADLDGLADGHGDHASTLGREGTATMACPAPWPSG